MAKIGSFNVTQKSHSAYPDAVQLFTDRENPQEAFERKLRVIEENRKEAFAVLCYYGIGGIGKTSLKNKLCRVIDGVPGNPRRVYDEMNCYHICYDFGEEGATNDKRSILTRLSRQIQGLNKGFQFYLFETALVMYAKKTGTDISTDETTSVILEKNPWLNTAVNTLGVLPIISWTANALQALDTFAAAVSNKWTESRNQKKYEDELQRISGYEPSDLLKYLHEWFILDMCTNMEAVADRPLVVFLDTYEKYVESMYNYQVSKDDDKWLRDGEDSLLQSIPGILWVVLGRERLSWADSDEFWKNDVPERPLDEMTLEEKEALAYEVLEQHLLGELSRHDALDYFKRAGLDEDDLAGQIYDKLTGGTPLFLDICVQEYRKIKKTKTPEIDDFGQDLEQLVKRYISGLSDADREMAGLLALVGTWNDALIKEIVPGISELKYFTQRKYTEFCKHSFVIKEVDGECYIHETVRKACLVEADIELIEGVKREYQKWTKARMEDSKKLDYVESASKYVANLFKSQPTYEKLYEEVPSIREMLKSIKDVKADVTAAYKLAQSIYEHISSLFPDSGLQMLALVWFAEATTGIGRFTDAVQLVEPYANIDQAECPNDIQEGDYYIAMYLIGHIVRFAGKYDRMFALCSKAYDGLSHTLGYGKYHFETLKAYDYRAEALSSLGKHKEALAAYKYVLFYYENKLGKESPDTIMTLSGVGLELQRLGRYDEALEIRQEVYDLRKKVLGEYHYSTLTAYKNIAITLTSLGKYDEAFEIDEYVYEKSKEMLGEKHPNTINAYNNLAWDYNKKGDKETALKMRTRVYELRKEVLGSNNISTLNAYNTIADMYYQADKTDEALRMHLEILQLKTDALGAKHMSTIETVLDIAFDYYELKQYENALEYAGKAYEARKELLGDKNTDTVKALKQVAINLYYLNREKEAYEKFSEVYAFRVDTEEPLSRELFSCRCYMAECKYYMGEYDEALPMLEKLKIETLENLSDTDGLTLDAINYLARTYMDLKQYKKAIEEYKLLYKLYLKRYGDKSNRTLDVLNRLAVLQSEVDDTAASLETYTLLYETKKEICGEEDKEMLLLRRKQLIAMYNVGQREDAYANMPLLYELAKKVLTVSDWELGEILGLYITMANKMKDNETEMSLRGEQVRVNAERLNTAEEKENLANDLYKDMDELVQLYRKKGMGTEAIALLKDQRTLCVDYLGADESKLKKIDKMMKIISIEMS